MTIVNFKKDKGGFHIMLRPSLQRCRGRGLRRKESHGCPASCFRYSENRPVSRRTPCPQFTETTSKTKKACRTLPHGSFPTRLRLFFMSNSRTHLLLEKVGKMCYNECGAGHPVAYRCAYHPYCRGNVLATHCPAAFLFVRASVDVIVSHKGKLCNSFFIQPKQSLLPKSAGDS